MSWVGVALTDKPSSYKVPTIHIKRCWRELDGLREKH